MEGNTLIFATVRKQGILFMVQSKTLTSARGTKENAVAGLVISLNPYHVLWELMALANPLY